MGVRFRRVCEEVEWEKKEGGRRNKPVCSLRISRWRRGGPSKLGEDLWQGLRR